jgi:preprotein translocase SecE subunit
MIKKEKEKEKDGVKKRPVPKQAGSYSTNPSKELKKVTWPNRNTLIKSTFLILVLSLVLTVYVSTLDVVFERLFYFLRSLKG